MYAYEYACAAIQESVALYRFISRQIKESAKEKQRKLWLKQPKGDSVEILAQEIWEWSELQRYIFLSNGMGFQECPWLISLDGLKYLSIFSLLIQFYKPKKIKRNR